MVLLGSELYLTVRFMETRNSGDTTVEDALERYFASLNAGGTEDTLRGIIADSQIEYANYVGRT